MKKYNHYTSEDITLVICTYKECKYLEECIKSIVEQTQKPKIMISTSTPNEYVKRIADKYNIEIKINLKPGQIEDYNFAMKQPKTKLVMLAHQDEVLDKRFVEESLNGLNSVENPIISFTDYIEMHKDVVDSRQSGMIRIKKILLYPLRFKALAKTRIGKRSVLCFGNPITHPSVICVKEKMPEDIFREGYKATMDWDLWERLSNKEGTFVYINKVLLYHRMNEDNQTVFLLKTTNDRFNEEYSIFCRFWIKPIAKILMKFYRLAYKNY